MLDRTDFALLRDLQRDAWVTNKELAARHGIAPSTCLQRLRRLRQLGVLRGAHAEVDAEALGIGVQAMISLRLAHHARIAFDQLLAELLKLPEVVNVYLLAGATDLLIHVAAQDVHHLRDVVQSFTLRRDVAHIETSLIFEFAHNHVLPNYRCEDLAEGA